MILDDHEIFNNFGWGQKNDFETIFEKQARLVYYQYQRQLWEDIDYDNLT
jgi:hypothetical protein